MYCQYHINGLILQLNPAKNFPCTNIILYICCIRTLLDIFLVSVKKYAAFWGKFGKQFLPYKYYFHALNVQVEFAAKNDDSHRYY
jgi:hypothetical protein